MEEEDTTAGCVMLTLPVSQPVTAVSTWAASAVIVYSYSIYLFLFGTSVSQCRKHYFSLFLQHLQVRVLLWVSEMAIIQTLKIIIL